MNRRDNTRHRREGLRIEITCSLPAEWVSRNLNGLIEWRGRLESEGDDNGPDYISDKLLEWAEKHDIPIQKIQPGKPQQNAYAARYNRTVRHEWLDQYIIEASRRHSITQHNGSGLTTTNAPTWALAE